MATEEDKQFYKEHRHEPYQQLERAIKTCDLRKIRYLIRTGKVDPNVRLCSFMSRKSLLHIFISDFDEFSLSQRKELIRLMVARGADIHVKNDDGNSILSDVADSMPLLKFFLTEFKFSDEEMQEAVSLKTLKLLIQNGLQISPDVVKNLFLSAYDVKAIKFLMEKYHVSVNYVDKKGLMQIHRAVYFFNSVDMIKFLLAHGADVNSQTRSGITPLMLATSPEIFSFLMKHGADVYAEDQQRRNVLLWQTTLSNSLAIIKVLVEQYHFNVNQTDEAGRSPLMRAVERGSLEAAKYLVTSGANVNAVDNEGHNALFYLYKDYEPDKQLLQYLIEQGINVNQLDYSGKNVLFYATKHIDLLLKAGADVTVVANDATTVLMNYSLSFSDFKLLIQHGADPSKYAEKLLRWWLADNHSREVDEKDIMLYLIKNYSLDPNTRNEAGRTPLFYHQGFRELGDTMETVDKDGNTPLIYKFTTLEYVFLDNEFSPQYYQRQNNEGKTALHYAVIRGMGAKTIRELLDHGADWRIKDNSGRTALDYARELKRFDICELLKNYNHSI